MSKENRARASVFHWRLGRTDIGLRMIVAVILAVVVHGLCFYVFQVQDPKVSRSRPKTFSVTILSSKDPNAAAILQQIDDYYAAYSGTLSQESELRLSPKPVPYTPSFLEEAPWPLLPPLRK